MFEKEIAQNLQIEGVTTTEILEMFETPKDASMGDVALPCFKLSKQLRLAPPVIAQNLKNNFKPIKEIESVEAVGGYLNFKLNRLAIAQQITGVVDAGERFGASSEGTGKTVCIDYSSVNIAKPFHIGHLSTTVIGGALYRIYNFLGYNTVGINHLGDWGTQFGKLIVAYKMWGKKQDIEARGIKALNEIYVKFHQAAKEDATLDDKAREYFKKIEDGDEESLALFDWFKEITLKDVQKIYDRLKIQFDSYNGESFYNDKMDVVIDILKEKNLLTLSDGAQVVNLDEYSMPPCLILKQDGATLYATRDIAAAYYRQNTYHFDKCLYVVAYQQNLHFKQVFKVLELMDFASASKMEHVAFGMVSLEDGAMSTREGRVVWLEDVLTKSVNKAREILEEKNASLENKAETAEMVGVGAVVFSALWNNRIKDIVFSFDNVLNFDGETAPYVQYTHARCASVLEKAGFANSLVDSSAADFSGITDDSGYELVKSLLSFPQVVSNAAKNNEPCYITRFVVDLAAKYNKFYYENRIMDAPNGVREARLLVTKAVKNTIKTALMLLGIDAPEKM